MDDTNLGWFNAIAARWGVGAAWRALLVLPALAFVLGLVLGAMACWPLARAPLSARLEAQQRQAAEDKAGALRLQMEALRSAQAHGDQLTATLQAREQTISQLSKDRSDAFAKLKAAGVRPAVDRPCLDDSALRLLDGAPGLRVDALPEAAAGTDAADARAATDSDLFVWALHTGAQYEQCRARLGALIEWHRGGK